MIKEATFNGNRLTIISEKDKRLDLNLEAIIYKVVHTDSRVAVLLSWEELENTEFYNRNIICLNEEGRILWRIVNQDSLSISKKKTNFAYSMLVLKDSKYLEVATTLGMAVDVDIDTGNFIGEGRFIK